MSDWFLSRRRLLDLFFASVTSGRPLCNFSHSTIKSLTSLYTKYPDPALPIHLFQPPTVTPLQSSLLQHSRSLTPRKPLLLFHVPTYNIVDRTSPTLTLHPKQSIIHTIKQHLIVIRITIQSSHAFLRFADIDGIRTDWWYSKQRQAPRHAQDVALALCLG